MSSGGFRVLHLVRPFLSVLPEVKQADRKVPFREKALYTAVSLFVFLVCSQCVHARGRACDAWRGGWATATAPAATPNACTAAPRAD